MKRINAIVTDSLNRLALKADALLRKKVRSIDDAGGDVSLDLIIGILVAVVLIVIVLNILKPQVAAWTNSITTKVNDLLNTGV